MRLWTSLSPACGSDDFTTAELFSAAFEAQIIPSGSVTGFDAAKPFRREKQAQWSSERRMTTIGKNRIAQNRI